MSIRQVARARCGLRGRHDRTAAGRGIAITPAPPMRRSRAVRRRASRYAFVLIKRHFDRARPDAALRWPAPPRSGIRHSICASPTSGCARRWICWRRCRSTRRRTWSIWAAEPAMSPRSCGSAFPTAEVVGVDGSASMLEKARAATPDCRFEQADFFQWQPREAPDLIYSNAALHWVDRHPRAVSAPAVAAGAGRRAGGADADDARHAVALAAAARSRRPGRGRSICAASRPPRTFCRQRNTGTCCARMSPSLDMWQTTYMHALVRRERGDGMGVRQQPAAVSGQAAGRAEGGVRSGIFRGRAAALSAPRRRHDAAAVPAAVHGGAEGVSAPRLIIADRGGGPSASPTRDGLPSGVTIEYFHIVNKRAAMTAPAIIAS